MEPTTTLADTLLDDLNDLMDSDDEGEAGADEDNPAIQDEKAVGAPGGGENVSNGANSSGSLLGTSAETKGAGGKASFLQHPALQSLLNTIRGRMTVADDNDGKPSADGNERKKVEDEDHQTIVKCNKELSNLEEELGRAHSELALAYRPKFPELEELLPNYMQYKNAVRTIWNEMDLTNVNDELNKILNSNQIITLSVAGSTTSGRLLTEEELNNVDEAASYIEQLLEIQNELVSFVEQSMASLAPSICALIGSSSAARLLGLAGGLAELTKIPACNLQVIGQVKQNAASRAGFSRAATEQHAGILAQCELISIAPKREQKKALKALASKLALAARFDFVNVDSGRKRSASAGLKFRQELQEKFEKWHEPDKGPTMKALPKPDLSVKKRRGGKRMRRWKERFEETAMMKQANTRAFSTQQGEYGDDAMGISMGLLDTADSGGAIRKVSEKRKVRQANSKASRKRAMQLAQQSQNRDGIASSVVFTQTTGMELINPDANKARVREANKKWFDATAGFQSALPKK